MADADLPLLQQQQNTMIIELRALTATVRRLDDEMAMRVGRVETEMVNITESQRDIARTMITLTTEAREINRKIDDIAARLVNLEIAR